MARSRVNGPNGMDGAVKVYYTGRPDLVVADNDNRFFPIDHKTTDEIRYGVDERYKPHAETAGYIFSIQEMLGKPVDRCVINLCAREIPSEPRDKTKEPKPRFKRVMPSYSQTELSEWRLNSLNKCEQIVNLVLFGDYWPQMDTQCFVFNNACEYHDIDKVKPESREMVIKADYLQGAPLEAVREAKGGRCQVLTLMGSHSPFLVNRTVTRLVSGGFVGASAMTNKNRP